MSELKNIAILGASGSLGTVILDKLVSSGHFNVTALKRAESSFAAPAGVKTASVNFDSPDSLKSALTGIDAVVSAVGAPGLELQIPLIDAAAAAGVKRFIPSENGNDLDNPLSHKLACYAPKVKVQKHLIAKSGESGSGSGLTYTFVYNGAFFDWGLRQGVTVDVSSPNPAIYDGGDIPTSMSYLSTVADATVGVLLRPAETANRSVRIHDAVLTQNQILDLARKVDPQRTYQPVRKDLAALKVAAEERLAKGIVDRDSIVPLLLNAVYGPEYGNNFDGKTDNELLGVKPKTEADFLETIREVLRK